MIIFKIDGQPQGKARPRFANGHAYTPTKTKEYEEAIKWAYKAAGGKLNSGYVAVNIQAFYKIPKATTKEKRGLIERGFIKPAVKPDIDNVIKAVLDGLNETAYSDDAQVVRVSAAKLYSTEPCVVVEVISC